MATRPQELYRQSEKNLQQKGSNRTGRPKGKTAVSVIKATEMQAQCLELRMKGLSTGQIAKKLNISQQTAWKHINKALEKAKQINELAIEDLRHVESDRLDAMQYALWPQAQRGVFGAVDRILKIMQRRAALWGLDKQPDAHIQAVQINISTGSNTYERTVDPNTTDVAQALVEANKVDNTNDR